MGLLVRTLTFLQFKIHWPVGSFLTIRYNRLFSHGLWSGMRTNSDEQYGEGEGLLLSLAHTAWRAHPKYLLYPMDKKLLIGQEMRGERGTLLKYFNKVSVDTI